MSELSLIVGQTAVGSLTFDEIDPPPDGAVSSADPSLVTITLDADHVTWTCVGAAVTLAPVAVTFAGTSAPPDVGPAVVPPMMVTVTAAPVAEHGDFNPS